MLSTTETSARRHAAFATSFTKHFRHHVSPTCLLCEHQATHAPWRPRVFLPTLLQVSRGMYTWTLPRPRRL